MIWNRLPSDYYGFDIFQNEDKTCVIAYNPITMSFDWWTDKEKSNGRLITFEEATKNYEEFSHNQIVNKIVKSTEKEEK